MSTAAGMSAAARPFVPGPILMAKLTNSKLNALVESTNLDQKAGVRDASSLPIDSIQFGAGYKDPAIGDTSLERAKNNSNNRSINNTAKKNTNNRSNIQIEKNPHGVKVGDAKGGNLPLNIPMKTKANVFIPSTNDNLMSGNNDGAIDSKKNDVRPESLPLPLSPPYMPALCDTTITATITANTQKTRKNVKLEAVPRKGSDFKLLDVDTVSEEAESEEEKAVPDLTAPLSGDGMLKEGHGDGNVSGGNSQQGKKGRKARKRKNKKGKNKTAEAEADGTGGNFKTKNSAVPVAAGAKRSNSNIAANDAAATATTNPATAISPSAVRFFLKFYWEIAVLVQLCAWVGYLWWISSSATVEN
jgi:hypothetical protein